MCAEKTRKIKRKKMYICEVPTFLKIAKGKVRCEQKREIEKGRSVCARKKRQQQKDLKGCMGGSGRLTWQKICKD